MRPWIRTPQPSPQEASGLTLRALTRPRAGAVVAMLACVCALASTATALAARPLPQESLAIFEGQLNGHRVSGVTLHTEAHTFHASLKDGRKVSVVFPTSEQQRLEGDIRARGITVKVAKAQSPSHKLRYIVGAVAILVIVLAVVGLLYVRRRRMREDEQGPGYR